MIINEDLKDIPVETMYKYLLRDYRCLQEENKRLKTEIKSLIEATFDEIDVCSDKILLDMAEKYHHLSKSKLLNEIYRLLSELNRLKSIE